MAIANKSKALQRDLSKLIRGLNTYQTKTSIYRKGTIIDNDFRKPFEGVVNEVRRRNTITGDD